jgi:hypothetical protein
MITGWSAPGWFLLTRLEDKRWRRTPLAGWGMVETGGAPWVAGLVVAPDGEQVELAEPGRYIHVEQLPRCSCKQPAVEVMDVEWCTRCGSVGPPRGMRVVP